MAGPLQPDDHYTGTFGPVAIVCDVEVKDGVVVGYVPRADVRYGCNGLVFYVLPPTTDEKAA